MMYATSQNSDIEFTTIEIEKSRFNAKQLDQMEEFIQKLPAIDPSAAIAEDDRAFIITARKHMLIETDLDFAKCYVVHVGITIYESEKGFGTSIIYNSASMEEQRRLQYRRPLPEAIISLHSTSSDLPRGAVSINETNYTKLMATIIGHASESKDFSESERKVPQRESWKPGHFAGKAADAIRQLTKTNGQVANNLGSGNGNRKSLT